MIGDLAAFLHQTGRPLPGVSPVAMQQGRYAAENIRRSLAGQPRRPFHYFDKGTLAVIGRASAAVAEIAGLRLSGLLAWLVWCFVHIFYLIGFRNRFIVMFEWAWAYVSDQRGRAADHRARSGPNRDRIPPSFRGGQHESRSPGPSRGTDRGCRTGRISSTTPWRASPRRRKAAAGKKPAALATDESYWAEIARGVRRRPHARST